MFYICNSIDVESKHVSISCHVKLLENKNELEKNTHFIRCLILLEPRKKGNRPDITEKFVSGM